MLVTRLSIVETGSLQIDIARSSGLSSGLWPESIEYFDFSPPVESTTLSRSCCDEREGCRAQETFCVFHSQFHEFGQPLWVEGSLQPQLLRILFADTLLLLHVQRAEHAVFMPSRLGFQSVDTVFLVELFSRINRAPI